MKGERAAGSCTRGPSGSSRTVPTRHFAVTLVVSVDGQFCQPAEPQLCGCPQDTPSLMEADPEENGGVGLASDKRPL